MTNIKRQYGLIAAVSLSAIAMAALLPPLAQPADYHLFADRRDFLGIRNFNNVVSNLAFLFSGTVGLISLRRIQHTPMQSTFLDRKESLPYWMLFLSVTAIAVGSMYYHWSPDNDHLLWDRLFIATAIAALLSAVLSERIGPLAGLLTLPPLTVLAVLSVLYWHWTEQQGNGNLNFYIVMQFYSILLIAWVCLRFPSRYSHGSVFFQIIALYMAAKAAEMLDEKIYVWTATSISGHTLKHLIAACAAYRIIQMLRKRTILQRQ
ncbi:MAG: alkaline phytoceramidase [Nitrosomonas sp.]|nr:MAG: alkaline phytoceramidase [Nitrosomonas sp.]